MINFSSLFLSRVAFENGFSGQILFDPLLFQLYNITFASVPIMIYALIDKQYTGAFLEANPKYYQAGIKGEYFNIKKFWVWFFDACVQSIFIGIIP